MKFDPSSARPAEQFDPTTAVPEEAPPVRAVLSTAVQQNPDQAARAAALGKQYGVPTGVVARNLQNVERQAAVDAAEAKLQTSPKLASAVRQRPEIAPLAHDDIGRLTEVEQAVKKYGELKAWNGPAPTLKNIAIGLAKAVPQAGSAIKAGLDAQMTDFLEWVGLIALDPITKADRARKLAQASGAADFTRPNFESSTGRAIYGGVESTLRMIPGLVASIATRSPTPMLVAAGVQTQGEAYGKYRSRGGSGGEAFLGATGEAIVEVATELLPAGFLTEKLGKAGVGEFVTGLLAREIPGEQVATLLQDAIDTAVANPDKTWGEYLAERPQAAYETLVSTLTQSALMGGVHTAARRLAQMGDQGQQADEASGALADLLKTAGASALRERSPEQFRALMGEMTDGKVYVDGEVLNQLPDDVKASLPQTVQDQIATAAATGDVVEIATADVLTVAPGTVLEETLVEHARTDPFAMSKADAAEATKLAQSSVMNDAQRLIQQAQDTEARQAEYDAIHKLYADQLNAAARFRPAVNEAKAHWLASFYTTMAARTGMTPAQFQAAHPVRVLAEPTSAGQQVMDAAQLGQAKPGEVAVEGYHFSKEDRPTLTTGAFGTGLRGSARDEIMAHPDARLRQRLSFYVDLGKGITPESGVGGRAHRAQLANIYDSDLDPLKLRSGNARDFEVKVLDAGYRGYLTRMGGAAQGQVILLGEQTIRPDLLGPQSRIESGKRAPALPTTAPRWENYATGAPEEMQAQLERMQANSSWGAYDLRVEGNALQYRKKQVLEQRGDQKPGKPVPTAVDAIANVNAAFELANGQQFKTNRDLKLALQERVLEALKAAKINLEDFNAGAEQYLVRVALMDAEIALETNPNAVGWYNEKVTKALRLVGLVHPEIQTDPQAKFAFVWAMAVTSNGLKVDKNFELAEQAYSTFKSTGKMPTDIQAGQAQAAINNGLALFNEMLAKHGFEALQSFMTTKATVKEIQAFSGLEVGGENLTTEVYGSAILGPKIGNGFFSNLYGRFEQLTMDRWLMRTWGRWTGTLIETNPEQVRAKRVQLRALIQGLDKDQKKAFETIIKRKLTVGDTDAVALAIWKASQKPINRVRMAEVADATDAAGQARLASILGPLKKGQKRASFGDELRKVGNSLTKYNDGQKEAPSGPPERNRIRKVFGQALARLQARYPALTMSDLQALLWYPEKRLYDAAKEAGEGETGYEDDAAPDYANAAAKLAREKGVPDADIARTIEEVDNELRATDRAAGAGRTAGAEAPADEATAGGVRDPAGVRGGAGLLEQQAGGLNGRPGNRGGRYSSGGLAPLEGAPAVAGATGPDARLVAVAEQYAASVGVDLRRQSAYAVVDPDRAARIAAAYEAMPHAPNDPAVKAAYDDLIQQTVAQYLALKEAGYKFWFMDPAADPYQGNPWNAMRDLRANQSMAVFPTEAGFGTGGQVNIGLADPNGGPNIPPEAVLEALRVVGAEVEASAIFDSDTEPTLVVKLKKALTKEQGDFLSGLADQEAIAQRTDDDKGSLFGPMAEKWGPFNPTYFVTPTGVRADEIANPLLADTGITWPYGSPDGEQRPVLANDLFRAVHDAFGHGLEGAGFRAQGEENAWQAHRGMFTGPALGALTSETRGQNSWLNYGPHGEANKTAKVEDTVFAEQKTGLMPEWTWTEGVVEPQSDVLEQRVDQTETPEFRAWFGDSKVVDENGKPLVVYHGTEKSGFDVFDPTRAGENAGRDFSGVYFTNHKLGAETYSGTRREANPSPEFDPEYDATPGNYPVYLKMAKPYVIDFEGQGWDADIDGFFGMDEVVAYAQDAGFDGVIAENVNDEGRHGQGYGWGDKTFVVFNSEQIKSATKNDGTFDANDPSILSQQPQQPRGTFNPATLELVLNPNANLSTFFHETGHFFLEVLADVASQPNAPAQIVEDMNTFLKWAGIADLQTWNSLDLDGKRAAHERWAESIEQYVMEGRAPSVELQPLMRRFATWLKSVYGSIKAFLAARGQAAPGGTVLGQSASAVQPDLFPGEFATKRTTVETSTVIDSKGTRAKGGNTNSKGQQVTATKQGLQRFWDWFAGSEATDDKGRPLVLYHSTNNDVTQFETNRETTNSYGILGKMTVRRAGIFLTPDLKFSQEYLRDGAGQNVMQAYAALKNPLDLRRGISERVEAELEAVGVNVRYVNNVQNVWELFDSADDGTNEFVDALKVAGYDGAIFREDSPGGESEGGTTYVAFESSQVKSATGNRGTFDVNDPSILSQGPNAPAGPQMALNDDIRRVMDRLLATDEQIAQANEVAGLVPDEAADAAAAERLAKRSMADLKWSVRARDQVIAKLRKQAAAIEKDLREQVTVEVDQTPEMRAKRALDALTVSPEYAGTLADHKAARKAAEAAVRDEVKTALLATNPDAKGLVKGQLLMKNKRDIDNKVKSAMIKWDQTNPAPRRPVNATDADVATIADSFGFESVDAMMQAIDAFGPRREAIDGLTEQRMLEEHGDLIDERAISEAANEAVHNEARARSLATELRTQREMLNPRQDTGETTAKGSKITVNALVEAAKQFAANVVGRTTLRDLTARAWQHTAAERRAAARWQQATAAGKTEEAVKAKQDQMLNHAAAKAAIDAKAEAKRILDFFKRVTKGNDETVVEKGRDPDIVNAARAALAAYGVQGPATKNAADYLETLSRNDPETYNVILPMVEGATRNAQPLDALTFEELQALHEEIQAMWFLAKRSRQMEVDGNLLDVEEVADEVYARLEEIGIPDTLPGETGALTDREIQARRWLQQVPALLRRVEQWAEAKDGKFGGPFSRFIFGPVKAAADKYRTARLDYRKKFQALVDQIAPLMPAKTIAAPELGYVFGRGHNGIGMAELLHAIAHTGNESNKRKLLLGRGWAADNGDGTIDTSKWDAFIARLAADGALRREHFDFVQGVWDLMEQTKPLAQQTHRAVFGRYFAEVTADAFVDPFGVTRAGGYIPAQADPLLVQDADLRELLETDNAGMSQAFPATNKGFTKARVEYNRPLKLDLRTLPQHIDKVLLFSHMEPAVRGVAKLLRQPKVSQPLGRVDPAAMGGMLKPWLNRSARQTVETPVSADAGLNRVMSTTRARVGMALMFANVSNTLQQITGVFSAALKVKPGLMRRGTAQFIASPKRFKESVWALSPYMADRASNEVSVLSDTMEKILINPGVFARAESWTRQHAYFLQTAFDNVMSPIVWTGAYNQGVAEGMDERMAIQFADGVIRQTQGSTLPEDVSRIETGPAYARVFTQFIGYFNMLANTNATALQQIAQEQGLKKGAGKAFGVVMLGLLAPIWVAEAIAHAMRGGPDDEDDDGYLDDWLAAVFGFGTIRGILAGVPFIGAAAQSAVNRFNDQPADDKFSLSPTVSVLESAVGAPASVYGAIVDDKNAQKAVRDLSALITVATGLPAMAVARPLGYAAGVAQGRTEPTGPVDAVRGAITGTASPESKQR